MSYFIPGNPEPTPIQEYIRSVLPENDTNSKVACLLPYIRTERITDPLRAMQIGEQFAKTGWYWSGHLAFGHDDSWYVEDHKWNSQPVNCRIIPWDAQANAGHSLEGNVGIVWSDWDTGLDGRPSYRLFVSVFGCDHEWTGKSLGNCYTETKCTKCGYAYRTDSSG